MEQYAIKKFAESLEFTPRTLGENGGFNGSEALAPLYAAHKAWIVVSTTAARWTRRRSRRWTC